jgi:hypothetical protein
MRERQILRSVLIASALAGISLFGQQLDPQKPVCSQPAEINEIVQRSVAANQKDWDGGPDYDYFEREQDGEKSRTYEVMMLSGSRYNRVVAVDEKPLSPEDEASEQQRFENEVARREREHPDERSRRIAAYQKERDRDHTLMGELTKALCFTFEGQQKIGPHEVYVLKGTPRRGYNPPTMEAKALTGMRGTLWVDKNDFHWVRAEAEVFRPIWVQGFFAQIQPGTRFLLEQTAIGDGLWMPGHFSMQAKAKVLFLFSHNERENSTYFGYHKRKTNTAAAVPAR